MQGQQPEGFTEHVFHAADGTRLYARDHAPATAAPRIPVVCLPGLTRNAKDFETITPHLRLSRRVVSCDFRGRGRSDRAPPETYRADQEAADTLALLTHIGIERFAVLGTSRGGLVAMVMATTALPRLAGVAFNDIGPRIDVPGLLRIRSYLGTGPAPQSWEEAVTALKATTPGFPHLSEAEWLAFARRVHAEENGRPRPDYDPGLAATFPSVEEITAGKVPELWPLLDLLKPLPCLVLRGANSDLLSEATVAEMRQRHPGLASVTVRDRGHVPFLDEAESIAALDRWLAAVDAAA